jgi:tRNA(adenine34) deaminase
MDAALALAEEAGQAGEVPVGAVIVVDDAIVASGRNRREERKTASAHAEIEALEDFGRRHGTWRLPPDARVYVTVEPCTMCTGALLWARATSVRWGCDDPRAAGLRTQLPLVNAGVFDHRFREARGGLSTDRCAEVMRRFFRERRPGKR